MRTAVLVCLFAALAVSANQVPQPFKSGQTYVYRMRTQVSSSLLGSSPTELTNQAVTGLQAQVRLTFTSDRNLRMQLEHIRMAELNGDVSAYQQNNKQQLIPSELLEKRQMPAEVKQKLELPVAVNLVDGVVERIQFHESDSSAWSKNIKRAVLNMLQLNLKRNDVQGLAMESSVPKDEKEQKDLSVFTVPEITLEGQCETIYTIQKPQQGKFYDESGEESSSFTPFNVTKNVNFNKCQRTADVSYGFQTNVAQQLRCLKCLRQANGQKSPGSAKDPRHEEQLKITHCQSECQTNQLANSESVERSTVARYEVVGKPQKYAIRRTQIISQYVVKAQNPAAQNTISQVVAISELVFKEQSNDQHVEAFKTSSTEETLLYSAEWDLNERRFYMYGDEEFDHKRSPFAEVRNKEENATAAVREIIRQWEEDKEMGYELNSAIVFNELVTVLRQSNVKELETIEQAILSAVSQQKESLEHAKSLFHDALAVAATRNSLHLLKQKIQQQEISTVKAAELVKVFVANQHSPSDRQADILEKIATSESAQRCPVLKQIAQLSFGAAVGKICQKQPAQSQNHEFRTEILCPEGKKEQYKKTLIQQWRQAETVYDQILALKTIGNAALTKCLPELEKLVEDKRQPTLIRMEAIDAIRRLRTSVPEKIQQILLPIFADQRDQPEVRMAALSMLLYTQPEPAILDQVIFSVQQDRSQHVRSYVLSALDSLSKSPSSAEQKIAQHLKAALKIAKITGEQMRSSLKYRVPIYVSEQENTEEQNVFLGLASIVSPSNLFPVHLAASIRSAFSGEATQERLQLSFSQKDLEHVYEKLANTFERFYANDKEDKESGERQSAKDLRSIYNSLGIKSRRTGSYYLSSEESDESSESAKRSTKMGNNSPFGMIVIRSNDVDQVIVPVDEHHLPHQLRKYLNGERNALTSFGEQYDDLKQALATGKHFRQHVAVSLAETKTKVPTSAGLPLAIIWQTTGIGSVEGRVRAQLQPSERKFDAKLEVRASGIATHKHTVEVWTPLIVSGVKSMRTIELNAAPFKVEIKANNRQIELIVEPPTEQKDRVLGLHTLPATYTQEFKWQSRTYEEPRLRTVRNRHLEQTQQEYHIGEQHNHAIRFEGNVHKVSSVKQLIHALYTTENNLHIFYKPGSETPTRVTARISGFSFRQSDKHTGPQFDDFYTPKDSRKHFRSLYDDEEEKTTKSSEEQQDADYRQHMQFPSNQQRHSKLSSFVGRYSAKKAYQHRLKVEVEARCPAKKHSAELELQGQCDHRMEHCKIAVNAQRTPLGSESSNWQLQAKLETVAPETVRNEEDPEEKHSRMLVKANAEWGPEAQSKVNSVEVRIQAEPTRKTYWRADSADKWSRFLNKVDLVADYQLRSPQRHYVQRVYELVKARNFWQIQVDGDRKGEENRVRASLLINPFTRQANLTIQTPQERVRAEMIQLPRKIQPMPLAQRPTSYQSLSHVIKSYVQSGAECQADDRRIKTFDGVSYRAPLSECYSVLAKDCSREDPRFVVLMKKSDEQTKVKIITKEDDIELQKESDSYKITVKVNGRKVEDEEQLAKHGVEKFEGQVYVNQRGVSVRFDGEEAKIKISGIYKNIQCGLCGHYSDEADVFRMSNNRRTPSLKEFHRSYTLKNQECDERQLNKFYEQTNSEEFQLRPRKQKSVYYRDSSYEQNDYEEQYGSSEQEWWSSKEDKKKGEKVKPVDRTHVLEYEHKVCFSTEPVKRCPRGTVNDEDSEERKQTKVQFFCLDRKSPEARRLHRQVRQGKVVDAEGYALSFFDTVAQDSKCQQQQIEAY